MLTSCVVSYWVPRQTYGKALVSCVQAPALSRLGCFRPGWLSVVGRLVSMLLGRIPDAAGENLPDRENLQIHSASAYCSASAMGVDFWMCAAIKDGQFVLPGGTDLGC